MMKWLRNESSEHESSVKVWDAEHMRHVSKYKVVNYSKKWWLQEQLMNGEYNDIADFDTMKDAKTCAELLYGREPKQPSDFDRAMMEKEYWGEKL